SASLTLRRTPNSTLDLIVDAFAFHSKERECFDIRGAYLLHELEGVGNVMTTYDIGRQIDHARNNFDALVIGAQHRGRYKLDINTVVEWGVKYQQEDIRDLMSEWELLDSTGYSIPGNYNPGVLDESDLTLNYSVHARNELKSN